MLREIRILESSDLESFRRFTEFNKNTVSSKALEFACNFLALSNANAAIAAELVDGEVQTCFLGYSPDVAWGTKNKVCPFWVAGHYKSIVSCSPAQIKEKTEMLGALLFNFFEQRKYYSFYMSRFVPQKTTFENCESDQSSTVLRALPISRYRPTVEELISNSTDFDSLPQLYRLITFDSCPPSKKIAIVRYDLMIQHRVQLCT